MPPIAPPATGARLRCRLRDVSPVRRHDVIGSISQPPAIVTVTQHDIDFAQLLVDAGDQLVGLLAPLDGCRIDGGVAGGEAVDRNGPLIS